MRSIQLDEKDGFSGEVAIIGDELDGTAARGFLRSARLVSSAGNAEFGERNGHAFLSFPTSSGTVTFEAAAAIVRRGALEERYPFDEPDAVKLLDDDLRRDAVYAESSSRFMRLAVERLTDLERTGKVKGIQLEGLRGDPHKPGSAAWGGIDVFSFVDCMKDCMDEDHWPVTCLVLCGAKAATAGGRLFPEK